jgi:hypothetical protein
LPLQRAPDDAEHFAEVAVGKLRLRRPLQVRARQRGAAWNDQPMDGVAGIELQQLLPVLRMQARRVLQMAEQGSDVNGQLIRRILDREASGCLAVIEVSCSRSTR